MATFVKKVIVGTPVKRVTAGSFDVSNLGGVNISGDAGTGYNVGEGAHNDLLVYDSSASEYRNLNTLRELKVDPYSERESEIAFDKIQDGLGGICENFNDRRCNFYMDSHFSTDEGRRIYSIRLTKKGQEEI